MARVGITAARMNRLGCSVECLMNAPEVREKALRDGTTRASAAVDRNIICLSPNSPMFTMRDLSTATEIRMARAGKSRLNNLPVPLFHHYGGKSPP